MMWLFIWFNDQLIATIRRLKNGHLSMSHFVFKAIESHEYHMKIVPTIYEDLSGNHANSFQYTFAYKSHIAFSHHGIAMPAIWFAVSQ